MTFSMIIVHVVEGNIENFHPSKNHKWLSTSAYASDDNGFLRVKIFNITLNFMN
jgi:hypothetical protein